MNIKTILIDDEPKNREVIKLKAKRLSPEIEIVATASNAAEGYEKIVAHEPDLIMLDISMPAESGLDMLKRFDEINFEIIFVTGYNEYALDALKVSAVDYLLKPVLDDDLLHAIEKVKMRLEQKDQKSRYGVLRHNIDQNGSQETKVAIPSNNAYDFVQIKEIIRCEGWQKYTKVFFLDGSQVISSYNIGIFKEMLGGYGFFACHKSHLINENHIKKYYKDGMIEMIDNSEIPVSRRKKDEFITQVLNNIKLK